MPRMLDLIRNSQASSNLMQCAARGALSVPPGETIEILVYLALHHKLWGDKASLTLAGWDEKASRAAAADPTTSAEVLGYFVSLENLRPCLLPALAENPSLAEDSLKQLAVFGSQAVVGVRGKGRWNGGRDNGETRDGRSGKAGDSRSCCPGREATSSGS